MGSPLCPKCGRRMQQKDLLGAPYKDEETGIIHQGMSKYWRCPKHKDNKYKVGGQTIQ